MRKTEPEEIQMNLAQFNCEILDSNQILCGMKGFGSLEVDEYIFHVKGG